MTPILPSPHRRKCDYCPANAVVTVDVPQFFNWSYRCEEHRHDEPRGPWERLAGSYEPTAEAFACVWCGGDGCQSCGWTGECQASCCDPTSDVEAVADHCTDPWDHAPLLDPNPSEQRVNERRV